MIFSRMSGVVLRIERYLLIALALAVTGLILLNVFTRSLNHAVYWVDELAIYTMIWMVMIGASTKIRVRKGIAVTILETAVGEKTWFIFLTIVDVIILCFALCLICLSWLWYDPVTLAGVGFDVGKFSEKTFNFIYQEPTTTLGVPKYVIWFIMPATALTMTLHALANLWERLPGASKLEIQTD